MKLFTDDLNDLAEYSGGCYQGEEYIIPNYPAEVELMGVLDDPLTNAELDMILEEAELMGIDLDDPELMGFFLKKLINKIKARFKKKKKGAAPSPLTPTGLTVTTPAGTAKVGPGGVSFTGKRPLMVTPTGAIVAAPESAAPGGIQAMLKNPMFLAAAGGGVLLLILMMQQKKRGKKK